MFAKDWADKVKAHAFDALADYAKFLNIPFAKPEFRVYDNKEMYVPTPEMIRQVLYRVRSIRCRARIMIAIETGASSGEIWRLTWRDFNASNKSLVITGNKGHRTITYPTSDELTILLLQIPKEQERIFSEILHSDRMNDTITDYKVRLAKGTGNNDLLKIHFHTFRHYAISWYYFKTKNIAETQRFAWHCNINNTLKYVHIVKAWIKDNQFDVVFTDNKEDLTKYLSEGYKLITKTEWGYCLDKPKTLS